MRTSVLAALAAASAGVIFLAGCSDDSSNAPMNGQMMDGNSMNSSQSTSSGSDAPAQFNNADVMFAQMMYPHHAQAVEMSEMATGRTENPDVLALASAIEAAQQPEMDQMTAWLSDWGQPAPSADLGQMGEMGGMGGMNHGSGGGMMTDQEMDSLTASSGPEFDRQWLTMMIAHHTGAIDMANVEIEQGSNPEAQAMSRLIVTSQQEEIDTMRQLLG
ncbi:DUF305 domain-containing protein [Rhodococcus sp. PAMC28707]|uniref:DUF305 domain-containing protein n=1 Tax=unclassified Rhodococcus (in: high G+C Gram-positive bacteria) TaxID=192944 RepID=UPI00109DD94B|nr:MULTISPECIES: DUF305 domain-containing protein [unclassified Rhodococcus (in: high G+C Gram-positive bacteria)]QCB49521.1 DUF305 domain-containing protein [Rhodococcus sp. PAMC28705]QCB58789.1 DUF305 domain-containing protein [Rhodococcus sp. PAMC28707]